MCLDKKNTMLAKRMSCLYWVKVITENFFFCKSGVFIVFALWRLRRWSQVKSEGNLTQERQKRYQVRLTSVL